MVFETLQNIGKALMTPVAVLPAAGLLLRLGAEDVFNIELIAKAGGAIFENLPALFAIGIAFGITKDNHGSAALAGYVGYIILTALLKFMNPEINIGVLGGIVSGLTAGTLYNRYHDIKLPDFLGFFGGTRFFPIITSLLMILFAAVLGNIWLPIQNAIQALGNFIINAGAFGTFLFGFLNRLLIPFGLHHLLNNFVWFVFGEYTDPTTGQIFTGDMSRFFAGDPTAGIFMAGGFPIFMFGLPAVCLAIYRTAKPENRPKISGMLFSIALTSFLTGITEPIEFSFMFLAPRLFFVHAVLMGLSMAVCYQFGVLAGCTFSMGLIDFVLNWGISTHPERIIPIGLVFAVIYYFVFSFAIVKFNLPTMGRVDEKISDDENISADEKTLKLIENLGGKDNLLEIANCATRLRLVLKDAEKINEDELKKLGALGIIRKGNAVQIIVGTQAEHIANNMKNSYGGKK